MDRLVAAGVIDCLLLRGASDLLDQYPHARPRHARRGAPGRESLVSPFNSNERQGNSLAHWQERHFNAKTAMRRRNESINLNGLLRKLDGGRPQSFSITGCFCFLFAVLASFFSGLCVKMFFSIGDSVRRIDINYETVCRDHLLRAIRVFRG
jgi:hypothetical protein